jgi:hypothetical protein
MTGAAGPDGAQARIAARDATRLLVLVRAELLQAHRAMVGAAAALRERFLARTLPEAETELTVALASLPAGPPADFHRHGRSITLAVAARRLDEFRREAGPLAEQEYLRAFGHMRARAIRIADAVHWRAPWLAERLREVSPPWIEPGALIRPHRVQPEPAPVPWSNDQGEAEEPARRRIARKLAASLRETLAIQCREVEWQLDRRLALSREGLGRALARVLRESMSLEHTTFPGHPDAP